MRQHARAPIGRSLDGESRREHGRPTLQRNSCCGSCGGPCRCQGNTIRVQTKVAVGPADNRFEREADRVASQVMSRATTAHVGVDQQSAPQVSALTSEGSGTAEHVDVPNSSGAPLPTSMREFMEPRFGTDFGSVRVHDDAQAAETSRSIGARAFTLGSEIWLGKGESASDRSLMAHELTHVVQQSCGSDLRGAAAAPTAQTAVQRQMSCDVAAQNSGGHDPDRDNLMADGRVNSQKGHLRCDQCP